MVAFELKLLAHASTLAVSIGHGYDATTLGQNKVVESDTGSLGLFGILEIDEAAAERLLDEARLETAYFGAFDAAERFEQVEEVTVAKVSAKVFHVQVGRLALFVRLDFGVLVLLLEEAHVDFLSHFAAEIGKKLTLLKVGLVEFAQQLIALQIGLEHLVFVVGIALLVPIGVVKLVDGFCRACRLLESERY